jgi:hypothetical protein
VKSWPLLELLNHVLSFPDRIELTGYASIRVEWARVDDLRLESTEIGIEI